MKKEKATRKKTSKKTIVKQTTVDVEKDIMKLSNGRALSLVPSKDMMLSQKQIMTMLQRTPQSHVLSRKGKGGGAFEYVTGVYVRKVLNYVFGFNWDFEILNDKEVVVKNKTVQIIVQGRLTVRDADGHSISKTQYGRKDVQYLKSDPLMPVDLGNDYKSASTDALKKCASEFGIASDVYGKDEFRDLGVEVNDSVQIPTQELKTSPEATEVAKTVPSVTNSNVDYVASLTARVLKDNKREAMTNVEIVEYVNKKLQSKFTNTLLTNQTIAQRTLGRLMQG